MQHNKTKENLTASEKILVFRIAGECWVMWCKLEQLALNDHKAEQTRQTNEIWWERERVYSIPSYSTKPPASGQEASPTIWQPGLPQEYLAT